MKIIIIISEDEADYLFAAYEVPFTDHTLSANSRASSRLPTCTVRIAGTMIQMTIDSGASANIVDSHTYQTIKGLPPLQPPTSLTLWVRHPTSSSGCDHCTHRPPRYCRSHKATHCPRSQWQPTEFQVRPGTGTSVPRAARPGAPKLRRTQKFSRPLHRHRQNN